MAVPDHRLVTAAELLERGAPIEVLRLTHSHGTRRHRRLAPTTDRRARLARRQLHLLLLPAMSTRSVALLEGPHDLEGYSRRRSAECRTPVIFPRQGMACGWSPRGGDGGKDQIPKLARLAADLRFHVRVVLDSDRPGSDAGLAELSGLAEQIIRLPERTSVARVLTRGLSAPALRAALAAINDLYGLGLDVANVDDGNLDGLITKQLKRKAACTSRSWTRSRMGPSHRWLPRS